MAAEGFALTALLLACIGVYGALSQAVVQRTRELGVRIALGASPNQAMFVIFRDGMKLASTGIAIGAAGAAGLTSLMRTLLFEIQPMDFLSFLAASVLLIVCAAVACYLPARRAISVDPVAVLNNSGAEA